MIHAFAAFEAKETLKPYEYDPGELKPNEVEIAVRFCGICHSDLSMIHNDWGVSSYPLVPGHEVIGEIKKMGSAVRNLKLHQTVGLGWHAGYCQVCDMCQQADFNLCSQSQGTIVDHHGGFADVVRADAMSVIPIPLGMDLESAAPLLCGGITIFNPLVQFDIQPTQRVAIIGIGGLGHMAIEFLNAWGCHVTAFTSSLDKQKQILEFGADAVIDSTNVDEITAVENSFDLIISTVNVSLNWDLYLSTLRPHGRFHFVGAVLNPIELTLLPMIMKQLSVSASPVGSPHLIHKMLNFAHHHGIKPVVETFKMSEVNKALTHLSQGKARYRAVLYN
jgi:alcohol/geraniol dehydrogenase (NADP+)